MSTWLITGCSTGLGRALAEAVIGADYNAVVTARDITKVADLADTAPERALAAALDVTRPEQVAAVKVAHSHHASNNPKAYYKRRYTIDDVLSSRFICKPLHLLDCCVETYNATAIIVTSAERAPVPPMRTCE